MRKKWASPAFKGFFCLASTMNVDFTVRSFQELIGFKKTLQQWSDYMKNLTNGQVLFVTGFSGIGKTLGTRLLIQEGGWNALWLDSSNCKDGKDIHDKMIKFHRWMDLETMMGGTEVRVGVGGGKKLIVIDELESLVKLDRNVMGYILQYLKSFQEKGLPMVIIGHIDMFKKIGELRERVTCSVSLSRLQDIDMFLFFKKRLPKNKIKLTDLMRIAEDSRGNIYVALQAVEARLGKARGKAPLVCPYVGDEHRTFSEIFQCKNPTMVTSLLLEDSWMHPLKIHENVIKVLGPVEYQAFLKGYGDYEHWSFHIRDSIVEDSIYPMYFLAYLLLYYIGKGGTGVGGESGAGPGGRVGTGKGPGGRMGGEETTMEFSKLLSYISTQKKYKKMILEKVPGNYPVEHVGYYWLQGNGVGAGKGRGRGRKGPDE